MTEWQHAAEAGAKARAAASAAATAIASESDRPVGEASESDRRRGSTGVPASAPLPGALRDELIAWLREALPNEGCGLLVADRPALDGGVPDRFVGLHNAAASPYRYLIDPGEQLAAWLEIDDADQVVWAIVHSHVASAPEPSPTDVGLAADPAALYIICSFAGEPPELRAWSVVDGAVDEVVLESV
jgi:proteasome lid subunit RPN8/RPN11